MADFNAEIIKEFRDNKGTVGGMFGSMQLLLLTTTGAKSGKSYTNPLAYTMDGDKYVIVASKGGAPTNPDWYHNLVANPTVTVEVGAEKFEATAHQAHGAERQKLFDQHAVAYPTFNDYKAKTNRQLPVFAISRI